MPVTNGHTCQPFIFLKGLFTSVSSLCTYFNQRLIFWQYQQIFRRLVINVLLKLNWVNASIKLVVGIGVVARTMQTSNMESLATIVDGKKPLSR